MHPSPIHGLIDSRIGPTDRSDRIGTVFGWARHNSCLQRGGYTRSTLTTRTVREYVPIYRTVQRTYSTLQRHDLTTNEQQRATDQLPVLQSNNRGTTLNQPCDRYQFSYSFNSCQDVCLRTDQPAPLQM